MKFVNATRRTASLTEQRRTKFVKSLKHQLELLDQFNSNPHLRGCWVWMNDGSFFINPVYGKKPLQLAKGKNAIQCTDLEGCRVAIDQLIEMTAKGELDQSLNDAANSIRTSFRKETT